ncbi:MAG: GNAT family N-acetyltransferase [Gemmatimonadota bacterium]
MESRVLRSRAELNALLPAWRQLFERDPRGNARNAPHRLLAFHQIFTPEIRPRVVVVHDREGRLAGVLPIGLRMRRIGPTWLRELIPLIGSHAYYLDAVVDAERPREVGASMAIALQRMRWERIEFRHIRPEAWLLDLDAGFLGVLPAATRSIGWPAPHITLPAAETLRGRDRKEMQRLERKLLASGSITTGWEAIGPQLPLTIAAFVAMHTALKLRQRQNTVFVWGSAARDFPGWLQQEMNAGRARLFTLRRDGVLLAGCVLFCSHGVAHSYRVAWAPEAAHFGLGILLTTRMIEACEQAGFSRFDMGPGSEPYKAKWHPASDPLVDIASTRSTWRQLLADHWLRLRGHSSIH